MSNVISFGSDLAFLKQHIAVEVLSDPSEEAQIAVVPAWQGRIMTSTVGGLDGPSHGWINRDLIASGLLHPKANLFGGEDRFWLGPEGGQFSVFFAKDAPFDAAYWNVPAGLDREPYAIVSRSNKRIGFRHNLSLTNYSGVCLQLEVGREIRLLDARETFETHRLNLPNGLAVVAFESINTIKNTGNLEWCRETGLLSIWILGMHKASAATTVVIPFAPGSEASHVPRINDAYLGRVPADRLVVDERAAYFRADGAYRTKIGLSPNRARPIFGSYDSTSRTLTIVAFSLPVSPAEYVNSMLEIQPHPFAGDVINVYNDGPSADGGKQAGQFYELESSSPALALAPGAAGTHTHQTIHLQGDEGRLDELARAAFGVRLAQINAAFAH